MGKNDAKANLRVIYQRISQIIVQLVRKDTLAIYSPDTDQFHLNDATLIGHLKSPDPLQDLVPAGLAGAEASGNTVTINDDGPQLLVAQAETRKNWPAFIQAFKIRGKDQYFAVKGCIIEREAREYLWLQINEIDDTQVHGRLVSDPETLTKAKHGAALHIPIADVDDWLYSTGKGKGTRGGYTLRLFDELARTRQKN